MSSPVREGDILDGKYRIERILGMGGMGVVVAANHLGLDQKVAIKFLLPEAVEHPEIVERFAREARVAAKIKGRNVVRVIDVSTLPDGRTFMVMEYLDGKDLETLLEERGKLPITDVISYVLQACEALAEAHAEGIVHRDLKPANLYLAKQPDRRSIIKVLDFGISKMSNDPKNLTKTSTAMGTAHYMSPEQLMNAKDTDARADIWALGVIIFELMSGVRPFEGESMPEIVAKILGNQRLVLRELRPDVPEALETIITKCLQTRREQRFTTVAELSRALAEFTDPQSRLAAERISRVLGRPSLNPGATEDGAVDSEEAFAERMTSPPTALNAGGANRVEIVSSKADGTKSSAAENAREALGVGATQIAGGGRGPITGQGTQDSLSVSVGGGTGATGAPTEKKFPMWAVPAGLVGLALAGGVIAMVSSKQPATAGGVTAPGTSTALPSTLPSATTEPATTAVAPSATASASATPTATGKASAAPSGRPLVAHSAHISSATTAGVAVPTAKPTGNANPLEMTVK